MRRVVITGASSGIGAAVSLRFAGPDTELLLIARHAERLSKVAGAAASKGSKVQSVRADVTDADRMADSLLRYSEDAPVDIVIANAGISGGVHPGGRPETAPEAARIVATNLIGAMNTVVPLLPSMIERGRGRIVLMSSLAALRPLPSMPAYGASKAGLRTYGIALRGALRGTGVQVTTVCPGFVTSPMSDRHCGARPWEVPLEEAASRIVRGIEAGRESVVFPWQLAVLTRLDLLLPSAISDRLIRALAAEIRPESD